MNVLFILGAVLREAVLQAAFLLLVGAFVRVGECLLYGPIT